MSSSSQEHRKGKEVATSSQEMAKSETTEATSEKATAAIDRFILLLGLYKEKAEPQEDGEIPPLILELLQQLPERLNAVLDRLSRLNRGVYLIQPQKPCSDIPSKVLDLVNRIESTVEDIRRIISQGLYGGEQLNAIRDSFDLCTRKLLFGEEVDREHYIDNTAEKLESCVKQMEFWLDAMAEVNQFFKPASPAVMDSLMYWLGAAKLTVKLVAIPLWRMMGSFLYDKLLRRT